MNIFIRLNIYGFFKRKYIQTFIWDFFLLMNIFEDSFGMLDSNEYIEHLIEKTAITFAT